jgi:hypothetical protein
MNLLPACHPNLLAFSFLSAFLNSGQGLSEGYSDKRYDLCDRFGPQALHVSSATALCHLLVGRSSDEDKDKLRVSLLEQAIKEVYAAAYRRWRKDHPELHYRLCIERATLLAFQRANRIEDFWKRSLRRGSHGSSIRRRCLSTRIGSMNVPR